MIRAAPSRATFLKNIALWTCCSWASSTFQKACMIGVIPARNPMTSRAPRSAHKPRAIIRPPAMIAMPLRGTRRSGFGAPRERAYWRPILPPSPRWAMKPELTKTSANSTLPIRNTTSTWSPPSSESEARQSLQPQRAHLLVRQLPRPHRSAPAPSRPLRVRAAGRTAAPREDREDTIVTARSHAGHIRRAAAWSHPARSCRDREGLDETLDRAGGRAGGDDVRRAGARHTAEADRADARGAGHPARRRVGAG